jgi:hypothetical protein
MSPVARAYQDRIDATIRDERYDPPTGRAAAEGWLIQEFELPVKRLARWATWLDPEFSVRKQEVWFLLVTVATDWERDRGCFPTVEHAALRLKQRLIDRLRLVRHARMQHLDEALARQIPSRETDPALAHQRERLRALLHEALVAFRCKAPAEYHEVLWCHWIEEQALAEIARANAEHEEAMRKRHSRAFARFIAFVQCEPWRSRFADWAPWDWYTRP